MPLAASDGQKLVAPFASRPCPRLHVERVLLWLHHPLGQYDRPHSWAAHPEWRLPKLPQADAHGGALAHPLRCAAGEPRLLIALGETAHERLSGA